MVLGGWVVLDVCCALGCWSDWWWIGLFRLLYVVIVCVIVAVVYGFRLCIWVDCFVLFVGLLWDRSCNC